MKGKGIICGTTGSSGLPLSSGQLFASIASVCACVNAVQSGDLERIHRVKFISRTFLNHSDFNSDASVIPPSLSSPSINELGLVY
ncbi:hypothetical protein Zmor_000299 [Zophobas morio]|uniref:Uncharacterized protein n=1 Tax=Zophobas morio TaxID=2755281 RepID=A0AA38IVZ2_9CUCU|nr:hypothetical protein Zmor_000299 [Zophobas morio]